MVGHIVTLNAELEPEPALVIVTNLQGGCAHAAAFGEVEGQTLEEAWMLIEWRRGNRRDQHVGRKRLGVYL